jgi:hypothetical protein
MSEVAIEAALAAENTARCRPPLDADEVARIARSIARYPSGDTSNGARTLGADDVPDNKAPGTPASATDAIVQRVRECAELFHSPDGRSYATVRKDSHRETWALDSRSFHAWLCAACYAANARVPREAAIKDALHTLSGIGRFQGDTHTVWLRVARHDNRYYLDLANDDWQVVEVSADGWRLLDNPPVRFRRTATMRALPAPVLGDHIDTLWELVNVAEPDRPFVLAWLLECLRPQTPTPVLELGGEQGSGKSDTQSRLRDLIDPSEINLRSMPTQLEHLFISAHNNWVVSLNNLSRLRRTEQDALCVLSTGGGFATRTLYSNTEETAFNTLRPVIMNGIAGLATAQDLVDRVIRVELPTLTHRQPGAVLIEKFKDARAQLLGALLDIFSATLRELTNVHIEDPPRMADYAYLGEAMFRALGRSDSFVEHYRERQRSVSLAALDASPVASAVLALMDDTPRWSGPAKALLVELTRHRQDTEAWPRSPRGLGDALRRAVPALRLLDISVHFDPVRRRDGYHITVSRPLGSGDGDA